MVCWLWLFKVQTSNGKKPLILWEDVSNEKMRMFLAVASIRLLIKKKCYQSRRKEIKGQDKSTEWKITLEEYINPTLPVFWPQHEKLHSIEGHLSNTS